MQRVRNIPRKNEKSPAKNMTIWHTGGGVGVNESYGSTGLRGNEARFRKFESSKYRNIEDSICLSLEKILHKDELGVQFLGSSEVFCLTL